MFCDDCIAYNCDLHIWFILYKSNIYEVSYEMANHHQKPERKKPIVQTAQFLGNKMNQILVKC